jgi:hypothetical protein
MAAGGRRRPRELALAESYLYGIVAVGRRAFDLRDGARAKLDHGHGLHAPRRISNLGHAQFFANQSS